MNIIYNWTEYCFIPFGNAEEDMKEHALTSTGSEEETLDMQTVQFIKPAMHPYVAPHRILAQADFSPWLPITVTDFTVFLQTVEWCLTYKPPNVLSWRFCAWDLYGGWDTYRAA